jgi:hypothetical protein
VPNFARFPRFDALDTLRMQAILPLFFDDRVNRRAGEKFICGGSD